MPKKAVSDKRLHAIYSGSVQGVGFRYTAERIAVSLGLTGWAENLPDGRVEIVCEGSRPDIEKFIGRIQDAFKSYIRDADFKWDDASGEYNCFDIRL